MQNVKKKNIFWKDYVIDLKIFKVSKNLISKECEPVIKKRVKVNIIIIINRFAPRFNRFLPRKKLIFYKLDMSNNSLFKLEKVLIYIKWKINKFAIWNLLVK